MTIKTPPRSALRIPYLAVRTPLGLLDEQVVVRVFGADSTAHRSLQRGLHTLDALAASAFAPGKSAASDEPPTARPDREPPTDRREPEQPITAEEQDDIGRLTDTFLAEDDLAPRSGELAENDELRRVQAEIRAKQEIETERGQL